MTHEGGYTPLNRSGMETHVSPLLKMTFETTTHFLTQAATHGDPDPLTAPSAAIAAARGHDELAIKLHAKQASSEPARIGAGDVRART